MKKKGSLLKHIQEHGLTFAERDFLDKIIGQAYKEAFLFMDDEDTLLQEADQQ